MSLITFIFLVTNIQTIFYLAMARQGRSSWRHYTFTQKANANAKVQAYLTYHDPGCSVVEACKNTSNGWKSVPLLRNIWMKKGVKEEIHGDTVLPLLDLITDELLCFFEYHEQGMIVDNGMLYISTCKLSRDFKPSLQCKSNSHFMLGEITCFSLSVLTKRVSKTPSRKSWVGFEVCCICKTNTHWPK